MELNNFLSKSSITKSVQKKTEIIKANDYRKLQHDVTKTMKYIRTILLATLFLIYGDVDRQYAAGENRFRNIYNDPKILKFDGEKSYTADEIRKSLSNSAEYWTSAYRNLSKEKYTASVRRLIRAGYLHGGFADVEIDILDNKDDTFLVRINEGRRYLCGDIIIEPFESFTSYDDLKKIIISPPTGSKYSYINVKWLEGEPAPMDEAVNPINFSKNIDRFLFNSGLNLKCSVSIKPKRNQSVAVMHVSLIKKVTTHTISEIIVDGSKKNSKQEILDYLQIKQGMYCDDGLEARLNNKLLKSARFLSHNVWLEDDSENSLSRKLFIQLKDYDKASPLSKKLTREEVGIVNFFENLQNIDNLKKDIVLDFRIQNMEREEIEVLRSFLAPLIPPDIKAIEAKIIFSNDGIFISLRYGNHSVKDNLIAAISYSRSNGLGLSFPEHKIRYQSKKMSIPKSPAKFKIIASLAPLSDSDKNGKDFQFLLGTSATSNTQNEDPLKDLFDINISPVASLNLLKGKGTQCNIMDKYLTIINSNNNFDTTATIDVSDNTLVSLEIRDKTESNISISVSMESGILGDSIKKIIKETNSLSNSYDPFNEFGSLLSTIVEISSLFIDSEREKAITKKQVQILSRLAAKSGRFIGNLLSLEKADHFNLGKLDWSKINLVEGREIPVRNMSQKNFEKIFNKMMAANSTNVNVSNPFYEFISIMLFQFKDDLFSVGSWPWVMSVKSMTIQENDLDYSEEFLIDLCKSANIGPLGCVVATYILANNGSKKALDSALKGLGKINADEFKNDYLPVFAPDSVFYNSFKEVAHFYSELEPDEKKLLLNIFETVPSAKETIKKIDQYPGKSIAEIMEPLLFDLWERRLRNVIKDYLFSIVLHKTSEN